MSTQAERADRAARVIQLYMEKDRFSPDVAVSELLCDIIAWCRREHAGFPDMVRRAVQIESSEHLDAWLQQEGFSSRDLGGLMHHAGP